MIRNSFVAWVAVTALCLVTLVAPMLLQTPMTVVAAETVDRTIGDLDANGTINMLDEMVLYRYVAGLTNLSVSQLRVADINGDGAISMLDVMQLYRTVSGQSSTPGYQPETTVTSQNSSPTESTSRPTYASVTMTTVTGTSTTATTTPTTLVGIDVSYAQGEIEWTVVQSQIDFAILRCGYGQDEPDQDDKMWEKNAAACEEHGIPYGAYFFCYARTPQEA